PEVLPAAPVGDEDDALAVRTEARLRVERQAARQARGLAARDRQRVEVAQQVEDDRLAVRADVEAHPRAAAGGELDRARRLERQALPGAAPARRLSAARGLRARLAVERRPGRGERRRGDAEQGRGEGMERRTATLHGWTPLRGIAGIPVSREILHSCGRLPGLEVRPARWGTRGRIANAGGGCGPVPGFA